MMIKESKHDIPYSKVKKRRKYILDTKWLKFTLKFAYTSWDK